MSLCGLVLVAVSLVSAQDARRTARPPGSSWKTAEPVVESTYEVWPRIQPRGDGRREVPFQPLPGRASASGSAPPVTAPHGGLTTAGGSTLGATSGGPSSGFAGISQTPWRPPDPTLAVGPDHVVETVNMAIAIYTRTGTLQFMQNLDSTGTPGFFEGIGGGDFCFDPKCLYDQHSGRFVVVALEQYDDTQVSTIDIAVSDDSDPNGTWYKYRTDAVTDVGGSDYWVDYPGLGVDEDAIYVTSNLFGFFGGQAGVKYRIFDKAPLLVGGAASYADLLDVTSVSVQAAHIFGSAAAPFFVTAQDTTTVRLQAITDPLGSPALVAEDVTVPSFGFPVRFSDFVPDDGGCGIDGLDGRLINAAWRAGKLHTGHGILSGGKIIARWYEFDTGTWPTSGSPTLVQSGDIDPGASIYTWFPTLASNDSGDVGVVLARSSSTEFASICYTGRRASDPAGTMTVPLTQIAVGTSGYCDFRWGDYFGIAVDPNDGQTFWGIGEYAVGFSTWQTWIASFAFNSAPVFDGASPCGDVLTVKVGDNLTYTVSATDADLETTTLDASGVPGGASHVPGLPAVGLAPSTTFSWTPGAGDAGTHVVTYTASDGTVTSTCQVEIRVKAKTRLSAPPF